MAARDRALEQAQAVLLGLAARGRRDRDHRARVLGPGADEPELAERLAHAAADERVQPADAARERERDGLLGREPDLGQLEPRALQQVAGIAILVADLGDPRG
jgi:hypothetical protein